MLMDEPFGAVDPIVRGRLQEEFLAILERLTKTVIFVTHDIDEAIRMGDVVAIMQRGAARCSTTRRTVCLRAPGRVRRRVPRHRSRPQASRAGDRRGSGRAVAGARRIAPHRVGHDASRRALDPAHGGRRRGRGRRCRRREPRVPDARGDPLIGSRHGPISPAPDSPAPRPRRPDRAGPDRRPGAAPQSP